MNYSGFKQILIDADPSESHFFEVPPGDGQQTVVVVLNQGVSAVFVRFGDVPGIEASADYTPVAAGASTAWTGISDFPEFIAVRSSATPFPGQPVPIPLLIAVGTETT